MSDITEREYFEQVQDVADECLERAKKRYTDDGQDMSEAFDEILHEIIDGHEWIIYTWKARQILMISPNESACVDDFGAESVVRDGRIHWEGMAFCAMHRDVVDRAPDLQEVQDEIDEAQGETP